MNVFLKKIMLMLSFVAIIGLVGCDDDDEDCPECPDVCDDAEVLPGEISGDLTLDASKTYRVIGFVNVQPGGTLTIPAGTKIIGYRGDRGTIQALRGEGSGASGKIIAQGTSDNPIVFTSGEDVGSRSRGDIGGIVLNGLAVNNVPGGSRVGEGGAGAGGGNDDTDNSGSLSYVRVEWGGTVISEGNEINGFSFNSVGSGTTLDHLQSHFIADDGFEWWGGTVSAKYLISSGVDDDNFDQDNGWRGTFQFAVAVQDPQIGNRGFECNNDDDGTSNMPISHPTGYNITLVGGADTKENDGMVFRANFSGIFKNIIVANFVAQGIRIDGAGSSDNYMTAPVGSDSSLELSSIMIWCKGDAATNNDGDTTILHPGKVSGFTDAEVLAKLKANKVFAADPGFGFTLGSDPFSASASAPDLIPTATAATDSATSISAGGIVTATNYIGAFDPNGTNWMSGWTEWARQ